MVGGDGNVPVAVGDRTGEGIDQREAAAAWVLVAPPLVGKIEVVRQHPRLVASQVLNSAVGIVEVEWHLDALYQEVAVGEASRFVQQRRIAGAELGMTQGEVSITEIDAAISVADVEVFQVRCFPQGQRAASIPAAWLSRAFLQGFADGVVINCRKHCRRIRPREALHWTKNVYASVPIVL